MILFFTSANAFDEKITFAAPEDLPPKIYNENGELKGMYVDIIREICKRMNVKAEFKLYPWARAIIMAKSGEVDAILPPLKTKERAEFLYFPSESMSDTKNVIIGRKKSGIKVKRLSDLSGLIVGVNDQYSYGSEFDSYKKNLEIDISRNEETQIKKLANKKTKRMDVVAASEEAFLFLMKRLGYATQFEVLYTISSEPSYVAFSKAGGEKNKILSAKFNRILRQLKAEGVVETMIDKYLK
jgi:polar amino acid transport system substrate-binding protein